MKKLLLTLGVLLFPVSVFAATITDLDSLVEFFVDLINTAVPIIIALAVLYFIWGVFRYVIADDDETKAKGKNTMLWGIIGIFVMISVWGLVNILRNTFNLDEDAPSNIDIIPDPVNNTPGL